MRRIAVSLLTLLLCLSGRADKKQQRPRIFGIAGVKLVATDFRSSEAFYSKILEADHPCAWCGEPKLPVFFAFNNQSVLLSPPVPSGRANFLREITFSTDGVPVLRKYLVAHDVRVSDAPPKEMPDHYLATMDPEGHRIGFTDQISAAEALATGQPVIRIIHAGLVVRSRAAEDAFYEEILGFRLYWRGGMKDGETDWVDMQVPDGTDWLEYMLNVSEAADRKELGVMNHIALGVPDIESARYRVQKNGLILAEQPKIGRDGKWQLNLYDPDETRVEFMEFKPAREPCCSPFTGPHPGPRN